MRSYSDIYLGDGPPLARSEDKYLPRDRIGTHTNGWNAGSKREQSLKVFARKLRLVV